MSKPEREKIDGRTVAIIMGVTITIIWAIVCIVRGRI